MINHKYKGPTSISCLRSVSLCFSNLEFTTTEIYMTLGTQLVKLLFNKQLLKQRVGVAFLFTQQVALFIQSGMGKYRYLLIQYQFCIRSARPKKTHTELVHDEQAKGNDFQVLFLFQALISCFKTFMNFCN